MDVRALQRALAAWYRHAARDLPWRRTRDPYRILVSEVMLQQTRVETVVPRYEAWLERFPDARTLAAAPEQDVLAAWSGLGYYRRARNLHAAAKSLAQAMPEDLASWRALPGVGPYTAAAVASIAQGIPAAVVDGNVERVAARVAGIDEEVDSGTGRRKVQEWAAAVLDQADPGTWNQAVMELGATVCTPKPRCAACPVTAWCSSRQGDLPGAASARPRRRPKSAPRTEDRHYARIHHDGRVLLVQEPGTGLLGGMWRLPGGPADIALVEHVARETGLPIYVEDRPALHVSHRFTHRVWNMRIHDARALPSAPPAPHGPVPASPPPAPASDIPATASPIPATASGQPASPPVGTLPLRWAHAEDLDDLAVATATRKCLEGA